MERKDSGSYSIASNKPEMNECGKVLVCVCVCVSQFHFIGIMMEQTVPKNREKQLDGHAIQFDNFNHVHLTFNTIFNFT